MFSKSMERLTLTSEVANNALSRINGEAFLGDWSFVATMRALVYNRLGEDNTIRLMHSGSSYSAGAISSSEFGSLFHAMLDGVRDDTIHIHSLNGNDADTEAALAAFDNAEKGMVASHPDFVEIADIRDYVSRVMKVRIYISEAHRSVIILADNLNLRKYHYLESFIPRYFPWYFADKPLDPEKEMPLLASLVDRYATDYTRLIEEAAQQFDLRTAFIRKTIGGFERRARQSQLDRVEERIETINNELRDLMSRYGDLIVEKDNENITLMGLLAAIEAVEDESELVDYFLTNKNIDLLSASNSRIRFVVRTYLESFDPDMFDTMIERSSSVLNTGYRVGLSRFNDVSQRQKLLKAIFSSDAVLKIKTCAYFDLDMRGRVRTESGYHFDPNCSDRIPNPHLWHFSCFGNHERYIYERLTSGDTIGAIAQCISSAQSFNIGDVPDAKALLNDLFGTSDKVIELPDGKSVSPEDALQWLYDQDVKEAND